MANVLELEGQLSWTSFFKRHLIALILLSASVVVPFLAINAGPGKSLIADVFALLVGTASLLHLAIWLVALVTRFHLSGNTLTFSRIGRRSHTAATSEMISIYEESGSSAGATVCLRDGTILVFPYGHLSNSQELVAGLRLLVSTEPQLEGCLNPLQLARTMIHQWLASCILLAISVFGGMCLAVFFQPGNLGGDPLVFLLLGVVLLSLAGAGFYAAILRFWVGSVRWFVWDGSCLRYRKMLSGTLWERDVDEIEALSARRPNSPEGESSSWRLIRFRNGDCLKLPIGTLQNADRLFRVLKTIVERRSQNFSSGRIAPITPRHPLWPAIEPYLSEGESVIWVGRPVYFRLWSEMSAEIILGLIPGVFGIGMLLIVYQAGVRQGRVEVWPFLIGGLIFGGIGAWICAAPWRYRKMLRNTLYAVTEKRILILNGLLWGSQSTVQFGGVPVESLTPQQVQMFEVAGRRRDILLGGQWTGGRRGRRHWVHSGFLAADDPAGAEQAIRYLLRTSQVDGT